MSEETPNPVGRPPLFKEASQLQSLIDGYFTLFKGSEVEGHPKKGKAPNVFGLCLYAGMSYDAYIDYENGLHDREGEEFSVSCKNGRLRVLEYAGEKAYTHPAGAVFNTINNTRKFQEPWKNAQHQEVTGAGGGAIEFKLLKADEGL